MSNNYNSINIAASNDAGSSAKWQNIINMYTVEDRDLDSKRAKLLHVWPTTLAGLGFELVSIRLQVSLSSLSATHQPLRFYD